MNTASADNRRGWSVNSDEKPAALEIVLMKRSIVLPWSQFLYAEGGDDEIRVVFATHDVIVRGAGLIPLMRDLAAQRVTAMLEPVRAERFPGCGGRFIREIAVQRIETGQG